MFIPTWGAVGHGMPLAIMVFNNGASSLVSSSCSAVSDFMIAGQIRGLKYALEPLPGNNKCCSNQKRMSLRKEKKTAPCDCGVFRLRDVTSSAMENSQLAQKTSEKKKSHFVTSLLNISW